ncbi:hypothetical protein PC116_g17842 [Phytophthora cactorum]|uniref:Uncharacterized protein n=1 Tax=Phytophthora cactorum TaxID=29920 RepID=A0A8T1D5Y5_9STRA|nr:hypothetical protein PC114_g14987 [Phytophthora cactorum]KAG2937337.1 hypothetical protein PC117_g11730 [Phytophthora cactorum]KAG3018271.1 hypothetical protein PC119_g10728 [Phytophthora cactorum]KAG4233991.1 hypothetical protein PC116_g17842 [Phytophthora cactorum]
MQKKYHHVHRLPVHEDGGQLVVYPTDSRIEEVLERNQFTMLTAFFELCDADSPEGYTARGLLYHEMPVHFVWEKIGLRFRWKTRTLGADKAIGRLISISPRDTNRYYFRLLLCYRRGPRSFEDLRTVDEEAYGSYKAAALAMGLLESDEESHRCLSEATLFQMAGQLRHIFAVPLVYCDPAAPAEL